MRDRLHDAPNHARAHLPTLADLAYRVEAFGRDDREHALLALRGHDLKGSHARFTQGHRVHVDVHANASARGRLTRRTDQSRAPEVLNTEDVAVVEQFEAGLNESLLFVGVTHLHARTFRVVEGPRAVTAGKARRREHRHPADAVATGARAEQHREVPHARRNPEHEAIFGHRTHAQHVHQRIAAIALVEGQFTPDRGHSDRVAITRDTRDDTLDEPALTRLVEFAKKEWIHDRQWSSAHRKDVAQDAPDPRCGALIGLNRRGVVVALDTNGDGHVVACVNDSGVLARPDEHVRCRRRQAL